MTIASYQALHAGPSREKDSDVAGDVATQHLAKHRFCRILVGCVAVAVAVIGGSWLFPSLQPSLPSGGLRGSVQPGFYCQEDAGESPLLERVMLPSRKGLALDDTTWDSCPSLIPRSWPATIRNDDNAVALARVFRQSKLPGAASQLKGYLALAGGKALIGTQVTCNRELDDEDWAATMRVLESLGASHVLGVAIGNELELLHNHANNCSGSVWDYFLPVFKLRLADLRALSGGAFASVPVMTVMAADVLKCGSRACAPADMTVHADVGRLLGELYTLVPADQLVIALNFYPYFNPCPPLASDELTPVFSCAEWLHLASCLDEEKCVMRQTLLSTRVALTKLLGPRGRTARLWIGEMGWASPGAATLNANSCQAFADGRPRSVCPGWSTRETLADVYRGFLSWDLEIGGGFTGIEKAFWFSLRDSQNFGQTEHFGICGLGAPSSDPCGNSSSKI